MGVSTHYLATQPIIERNLKGHLSIKTAQMGRPFITPIPRRIDQPCVRPQPLPVHREIETLERAEKPSEGLFAALANWISEFVKTFFKQVPLSAENHSLDTRERDVSLLSLMETAPQSEAQNLSTSSETVPEISPVIDDLSLTTSDTVHTLTNTLHWSLTGATLYGVAPQITVPISILATLSAEAISFLSLPKDTHWLRKLFSLPGLARIIINYNPWIARLFQASSFFNNAQHSSTKLATAWKAFKEHPKKALKAGALHLFNLVSNVVFTAKNAGLIDLALQCSEPTAPCNPNTDENCSGPVLPFCNPNTMKDCFGPKGPVEIRRVKLATVYNNHGNQERDKVSSVATQNHAEYAQKWDLEHDIITHDLAANQCKDPKTNGVVNCSPYMNKIQYFRQQCQDPTQRGKWVIYGDDDLLYTNPNINPWTAIDLLRGGEDTSLILTTEEGDWGRLFEIPGHPTYDPRIAINSGFIIARIDNAACDVFEKTWAHRNTQMNENHSNFEKCPTIAYCKNHGITSLGDQTAMAAALQDNLGVTDKTVTLISQRDRSSPTRGHIALNTLHRGGCHQEVLENGSLSSSYDSSTFDGNGRWEPGDWTGQTAGFRLMGKYPLPKINGRCMTDLTQPIENIRMKKIQEMLSQKTKNQHFTVAMTYTPNRTGDPSDEYSDMTEANHRLFATLNHADFIVDTAPSKLQCEIPSEDLYARKEMLPCVSYWRKVEMIDRWLDEPAKPDTEEWFVCGDNDGIYGNPNLDLSRVTKELQGNRDASIIIAKDIAENISLTNTGFIMVRKDAASRNFVNAWLKTRNDPPNHPGCPSLGLCKNQANCLHEQEGFNRVMTNWHYGRVVSLVSPEGDDTRPFGVNTYLRNGCFHRIEPEKGINDRITFNDRVKAERGDLFLQAAGVPPRGIYCHDPDAAILPIRKHFIQKMLTELTVPPKHYPAR
jgi:hypothetical protein